jgi:hypothetical protein
MDDVEATGTPGTFRIRITLPISLPTYARSYKTPGLATSILSLDSLQSTINRKINSQLHQFYIFHLQEAIMARGEANQIKVHYKGKEDDFVIFVDDAKSAKDWVTDKTIPLAQVVSAFKIFVTGK